jgi:hypothetical protein
MIKNKILVIHLLLFSALLIFYGCGKVVKENGNGTSTTSTISTTSTTSTTIPGVATPTFTGTFLPGTHEVASLNVEISTATAGAQIYYTTDGSTPSTSSPQYTGPINLTNSATISAIAVLDSDSSGVLTGTFYIRWWSEVGGGINGPISAVVIDGSGNIYVGGKFTTAGGSAVLNIARWNGVAWEPLGEGLNGSVYSLAVDNDYLYAGGAFTQTGTAGLSRIARWNLTDGGWEKISTGFDDSVYTVQADVYESTPFITAGGAFEHDGTDTTNLRHIAVWGGINWDTIEGGANGNVLAQAYSVEILYVGGEFTTVDSPDVTVNYIARFDPSEASSWDDLDNGMNDVVRALCYLNDGRLFAGGNFTEAGSISANHIAFWNTSSFTWNNLGDGLNESVRAIADAGNGNIYAGGDFTATGTGSGDLQHIARWNNTSSAWEALGTGITNDVYALAVDTAGNLYAGGVFTQAGGLTANHIAVWGIK